MRNERMRLLGRCLKLTLAMLVWDSIVVAFGVMTWQYLHGDRFAGGGIGTCLLALSLVITVPVLIERAGVGVVFLLPFLIIGLWLFAPFQLAWYAIRDTWACIQAWRAWSHRSNGVERRVVSTAALSMCLVASIAVPNRARAENGILTGDPALACDAILCLSTGQRPNECAPSLERYFGIHFRDWGDTVNARRDFLHLCPSANTGVLPTRIDAIVNGAGRCDAAYLNATNRKVMIKHVCPASTTYSNGNPFWSALGRTAASQADGSDPNCVDEEVLVINNEAPGYCVSYDDAQLTWMLGVTYVGDPLNGGHWVDDASIAGKPIR
ncbi:TrbM/KikA/MpfK family conjugal transfer protein [Burkholderia stagnalis]